ncbi:protein GDAP2 homolog isoform X1 [Hermetia illucens]|nr:protein GDAP2 homolog isoform X1 [Hermetia illucens]XP_037906000.1 protein GDAP2 homolog isoform X1 [Hermetia illucens]XP_037906010.1 protein GDAP2 homolog isoform X1 [Hermetia illucens]
MRLVLNTNENFDSIGVTFQQSVKVDSLPTWGSIDNTFKSQLTDYSSIFDGPRHRINPFPLSKEINNRFIIWDGDITLLQVDAITNTTNETLTERNFISDGIFGRAGSRLKEEISSDIRECRTGEVRVTKGYDLPAEFILHTVGPRFSERYKTAAENTLYSCYRNVLCKAKDLNLKTIALCIISATQRNFPPDLEAHIALRTLRRFLEQSKSEIVILCIEPHQRGIYEVLAPLYFPRNRLEESSALWHLPKDIGGPNGEPQYPDRQIRIIHNPHHSITMIGGRYPDDDSDTSPHDLEGGNSDLEYGTVDINSGLNLSPHLNIGQHAFSQMQGDLDRQRLLGDRPRVGIYESVIETGVEGIEHQERYERLLRRARTEDLSEISGIGCLYQSGVDRLGRPVVVFCGKWFPASNVNLDKALLYLIHLLDPIVRGDYVIAYFHTLTSTNNYPSLQWLREVYSILPYKYKKNLKAFYIVHPTFWTKMMTWWFTTFMAPAIKAKVHSLPGVEHLYSAISKEQLEIPAYITEYDMATNGLHYFQPITQNTSS